MKKNTADSSLPAKKRQTMTNTEFKAIMKKNGVSVEDIKKIQNKLENVFDGGLLADVAGGAKSLVDTFWS